MEFLIKQLLDSLGIDPKAMMVQAEEFMAIGRKFEDNIAAMKEELQLISHRLSNIEMAINPQPTKERDRDL